MKNQGPFSNVDWLNRISTLSKNLVKVPVELVDGFVSGAMPRGCCFLLAILLELAVLTNWDHRFFAWAGLSWLYPRKDAFFYAYYALLVTSPFWLWAIAKCIEKNRLKQRLTDTFGAIGLNNNLGRFPNFVFDKSVDEATRKLRLTKSSLSMDAFQKAKASLESSLQIYIDEIRESRAKGTVDIFYAHSPLPELFVLKDIERLKFLQFVVGATRSGAIKASLFQVPHLLIAGQTGGGKSTFLRQFITSLFLIDKAARFLLIDLKGGLEFQIFERLESRIRVVPGVAEAVSELASIDKIIASRMKLLHANKCKDIEEYFKLPPEKRKNAEEGETENRFEDALNRHFIVVDEAAEMFLSGNHATSSQTTEAKKILSRVARQGRSLGIHLVVATQRPDSRALDPQIKANLTGTLCFQMVNDASSILVLGNGRATDLPPIPGRAIWRTGLEMVELQTPYISTEDVETLLEKYREPEVQKLVLQKPTDPNAPPLVPPAGERFVEVD